ncbi:MAG: hypothetical protein LCH26_00420 [Proteobacteria bacterium]|nr:hypothetical protein [Pseudomonadota bacterium]
MDDQFICGGLPLATSHKFIGLIAGGMSEGPLLFETLSGDYISGGLNSASRRPHTNALLQNAIVRIEGYEKVAEESNKEIYPITKRLFMSFLDQNLPIYNAFQALTPELIEKIHLTMAPGSSGAHAAMAETASVSLDTDGFYEKALLLRDGKISGHSRSSPPHSF